MGISHSTYHFYGVHVPKSSFHTDSLYRETNFIDGLIKHTPKLSGKGLSYVEAGDYDRNELFLCVTSGGDSNVALGSWTVSTPGRIGINRESVLRDLIEAAGYQGLGPMGWITVPDCS